MAVATVTLLLATLGFLSPASRGALVTTTVMIYVLMSSLAGGVAVMLWGQVRWGWGVGGAGGLGFTSRAQPDWAGG